MARAARIALDVTLYSIKTLRPVITSVWGSAKNMIRDSRARVLVENPVVTKLESGLDSVTSIVMSKLTYFRDLQLPGEQRYLEQELEKVKKKLGGQSSSGAACQAIRPKIEVAWSYVKVECVPPMTMGIFNGPLGDKLGSSASGLADSITGAIRAQINSMDAAVEREKKEKEAAIIAAQEKIKVEEMKKKLEAEKKALDVRMAKEKEAAAKQKQETKKGPQVEKKEKKDEKKKPPEAAKSVKRAPPKAIKSEKKTPPSTKKG